MEASKEAFQALMDLAEAGEDVAFSCRGGTYAPQVAALVVGGLDGLSLEMVCSTVRTKKKDGSGYRHHIQYICSKS